MTKTLHEAIAMPSRDELRKAMHTLDLAICAVEDSGPDETITASQLNTMRDAYEVLDWFVR